MSEVTEYTREECIPKLIAPNGVEYGVVRLDDVDLYEIRAMVLDDMDHKKPSYAAHQPVKGRFSGYPRAYKALGVYLNVAWDASDALKLKNMTPTQRARHSKEQVAA